MFRISSNLKRFLFRHTLPEDKGLFLFFHLHRDQHIHLRGVFERKLANDGREKPVHDHGLRRLFVNSAAPHVEEGFFGDLAGACLVRDGGRAVPDPDVREGITLGASIQDESVALDLRDRPDGGGFDIK